MTKIDPQKLYFRFGDWLLLWVPPKATKHCALAKGCHNVHHMMLKG